MIYIFVTSFLILRLLRHQWLLVFFFFEALIWIRCNNWLRLWVLSLILSGLSIKWWRWNGGSCLWCRGGGTGRFGCLFLLGSEVAESWRRWFSWFDVGSEWNTLTFEGGEWGGRWLLWLRWLRIWRARGLCRCTTLSTSAEKAAETTSTAAWGRWWLLCLSWWRNCCGIGLNEIRIIFVFDEWESLFPRTDRLLSALETFKVAKSVEIAND